MGVVVDGRRQRGATTRAAILDAAEVLFSTGGFHGTSLRAIAAEVGMSHPGVLKHFADKGDLLTAVLERYDERNRAYEATLDGLAPDERLLALARFIMSTPAIVQVNVALLGDAIDDDHRGHDYVGTLIDRAEAGIGVDGLATWNGAQLLWLYLPDRIDPPGILQSFVTSPTAADNPVAAVRAPLKHDDERPVATREQEIVAAAAEAFARGGYRATGLREIAAALGLTHGALLYHFASKVDLLTAVLEERDRDEALPWSLGSEPLDYLNGMYLQALHNEEHPQLGRLFSTLVCEATDPGHPAHAYFAGRYARFHAELRAALASLVTEGLGRADLDVDLEAWTLIALWEGLGLRRFYREDDTGIPERLRARVNSLLNVKLDHALVTTG